MVVRKPKHELLATENEFDPGLYLFFFPRFSALSMAKTECQ